MVFPALCFLATAALGTLTAADSGTLRGQVVDRTLAGLSPAMIRVMQAGSGITKYRTRGDLRGNFAIHEMEFGVYTLAVSVAGFREKFIRNINLNASAINISLGKIPLDFAGCDAPTVMCDDISATPTLGRAHSEGDLALSLDCAADTDDGKVYCRTERKADISIKRTKDNYIHLESRNGATLADANAPTTCPDSILTRSAIRIDGLGPGSDICIRTSSGRRTQLFLTSEVEPSSKHITFHYVTR